ncbi:MULTISPECIES: 2-amino-4-hydroxy-6-hydroxymethyldihydropteridine diphosphokinase [Micromonospora]|uniref:2-amino-4-hydroxy-6-hydroxymethyldihydropteridine diphosphokinase n=2 Tax=Micromonospora TaxID=1873 RepID=A0A1C6RCB1_9ACTN|nr:MULTISPECIES: 2-amino-4-hydroxy-6-hydroxymethyldihydropteridine diphosphokinase [Micromonospora]TWJ26730.1 2-amino-4-hydroxy-6-hydroxymethyldihydropteridine diphosphokinase [Micromonospora sagamiensis]BCL14383.1 2-amino-4-hydroxy-6-hydroxymethyldihydropteridine diphosphokinase [Micromonospora sagamiensis]SCL14789.1 2-amino-4-hydroxy-6-hydroxymethyldihydropteridinediphosphokinase [Micromonospora inyonensis]
MTRAVLSLGSNLGDRLAHLRAAVAHLGEAVRVVSGVYETPPWGDTDQPAYLNAVLLAEAPTASARDWLDRARDAERAAGRRRDPQRRFGPRTLDVDVVAVWDDAGEPVLSDDPELTLPHPRAHLRAFVLRPWIDIQPYGRLPGHGWLTDLLTAEPVAGDALELRARPELTLESTA